jgi:hypothetical protein
MAADRSKRNETETQQKTGRAPQTENWKSTSDLDETQRKNEGTTKIQKSFFIEIQTTDPRSSSSSLPPFFDLLESKIVYDTLILI